MSEYQYYEFLAIESLANAGIGCPIIRDKYIAKKELDDWLLALSPEEVFNLLKLLLAGQGFQAERNLRNHFLAWRRDLRGEGDKAPRRTVAELWRNAEAAEKIRHEKEKLKRERLEESAERNARHT